jgi:hypothetical protein
MKKLFLIAAITLLSTAAFAQSEKYVGAMKANIAKMDSAFKNSADLQTLANSFERIAVAEKNQWLPYYYAADCMVNVGFMEKDKTKTDGIADKATALINKADSLAPNNSEISCIKSMIASCHMMVNPMQRYMEYGEESSSNLEAAMAQDPTNPRPYMLKGQTLKFTPAQFGGGCSTAKPVLQTALDKFAAFKPASELHPTWGLSFTQEVFNSCK